MKKGIVEIFVLAILKKGPSYGYKIVSDLSRYTEISESTLYPILRRLESNGELRTYNELFQGRNRKYYAITASGISHINQFTEEWQDIMNLYDILLGR